VIDDFDGDAGGFGFWKGTGGIGVEGFPRFRVDFGFQGGFEGFVGITDAKKIGVPNEDAFLIVIGVDEPAGDPFRSIASDFSCAGVEDIDPVDLDLNLPVFQLDN